MNVSMSTGTRDAWCCQCQRRVVEASVGERYRRTGDPGVAGPCEIGHDRALCPCRHQRAAQGDESVGPADTTGGGPAGITGYTWPVHICSSSFVCSLSFVTAPVTCFASSRTHVRVGLQTRIPGAVVRRRLGRSCSEPADNATQRGSTRRMRSLPFDSSSRFLPINMEPSPALKCAVFPSSLADWMCCEDSRRGVCLGSNWPTPSAVGTDRHGCYRG